MEQKTIPFDLSEERLAQLADKKFDEGDYLAGLRFTYKIMELYGAGADEFVALADAYDDLELYDLSADSWFRFLDVCEEDERAEAYEGLYNCFFHLGNEALEQYYYSLLRLERSRMGQTSEDAEYFPDEEEPEEYEDGLYEITCPACGEVVCVDEEMLTDENLACPNCGTKFEVDFGDEEASDESEDKE